MFTVLSDLSLIGRRDVTMSTAAAGTAIQTSGLQGTWVTLDGADSAAFPLAASTNQIAWPIFNESKRDQTVGAFAPDVALTSKVTILFGKYYARTTVFTGAPTIGQALDVNTAGVLVAGTTNPVAYCVVPPRNIDYLGKTVSAMDIFVI
jgi:hypothetical protein